MVYADNNVQKPMGRIEAGQRMTCDIRMRARFTTGSHVARVRVYGPVWSKLYSISTPADFYVAGRSMVHGSADLMADFEVQSASAESSAAPV